MTVAIVGSGYVGLVTAVCLAKLGNRVVACDRDEKRIDLLRTGEVPFYEPELAEMLQSVTRRGLLTFTTSLESSCETSSVVFIAVGTPSRDDGSADLGMVEAVVDQLSSCATPGTVITVKSTVPPGTGDALANRIRATGRSDLHLVSNPEFLREGRAVYDFLNPDKLLIGGSDAAAIERVRSLYNGVPGVDEVTILTTSVSAELAKYAANAMLATRISFMNEIAQIARSCSADISAVRSALAADPRIGQYFLNSGIGYGGSCFPKDVKALQAFAHERHIDTKILGAVDRVNEEQPEIAFGILRDLLGDFHGKTVAVWGASFKPETDDLREAPSLKLIARLLEAGASVRCYDPIVSGAVLNYIVAHERFTFVPDALDCVNGSDTVALVTEWAEFQRVALRDVAQPHSTPIILDCRQVLSQADATEAGINLVTLAG